MESLAMVMKPKEADATVSAAALEAIKKKVDDLPYWRGGQQATRVKRSGLSQATASRLEAGKSPITLARFFQLAYAADMTQDDARALFDSLLATWSTSADLSVPWGEHSQTRLW